VWFDSGSSHEAVLAKRPELTWPADLYLEGTDQYRGWFQSSLLIGVGTRDRAPYTGVLTHGFVVDLDGRKMSKSLGNVVAPQQVMKESGAEVLRLWVSMVDYRDEVRLGKEVLSRTVEAYRKIRNTFKYLLSNLYDFDPARDMVDSSRLLDLDRYAMSMYSRVTSTVLAAYEAYDFQTIFHAINEFVTVDLSAFYLDVLKDRLYTFRADSLDRRSGQTAVYLIADGLTRLLAPILSITADEIWRLLPGPREECVHLALFPTDTARWANPELDARWRRLLEVRAQVNGALEAARQRKEIGNALSAHVTIRASSELADLLQANAAQLPMLFITSSVDVHRVDAGDLTIDVTRATGDKCPRCWRFVTDAAPDGENAGLCGRCTDAVGGVLASAR
jgi:isoleucyl-tRNA synthetase